MVFYALVKRVTGPIKPHLSSLKPPQREYEGSRMENAAAALDAIARQPDAVSDIQRVLIIALGFIESLVIYALLVFFLLQGHVGALVAKAVGTAVGGG